jgi:hypothetical protein
MFGFRRRLLKNEIASTRKFCRKFVNKKVNRPIVLNRSNAMITVKSTRSNIFASIFFALSIEAAALVSVHAQSPGRTITVIGTGAANAVASSVSLQLTVTSQDVTATGLFVKQKDVVDRLEQAMEKAGVSSKNISEEPFRLMPNVEYGQQVRYRSEALGARRVRRCMRKQFNARLRTRKKKQRPWQRRWAKRSAILFPFPKWLAIVNSQWHVEAKKKSVEYHLLPVNRICYRRKRKCESSSNYIKSYYLCYKKNILIRKLEPFNRERFKPGLRSNPLAENDRDIIGHRITGEVEASFILIKTHAAIN